MAQPDLLIESLLREQPLEESEATRSQAALAQLQAQAFETDPSLRVVRGVLDVGKTILRPVQMGVSGLFRAVRAPQQALAVGPTLAGVRSLERGRAPSPREIARTSLEAIREDLSFRDVTAEAGLEGGFATTAGLLMDLTVDPLFIVTPAKIGRLTGITRVSRQGLQAVGRTRAGRAVGRTFVTDFGKPTEFVEVMERHQREVARATERAVEIGKRIAAQPEDVQRGVREYMIAGTVAKRQAVLARSQAQGLDRDAVGLLGHEAMVRDVELGQELVDVGLMSERTFQRWAGKHMRREFLKHADPPAYVARLAKRDPKAAALMEQRIKRMAGWQGVGVAPLRERLAFLKQRQDLPPAILDELGEVLEAAFPVARGQALAGRAVATRKALNTVSQKFGLDDFAPGYVRMGSDKSLGPLAGKWVPDAVAEELNQLVTRPGEFLRRWQQGVGWWKYGKVVLNPGTHSRNILSNTILAHMAGLAPVKVHRYTEAMRSLITKDRWYQEAREAGSFLLDTFAGVELPKLLNRADDFSDLQKSLTSITAQLGRKVKGTARAIGRAYQGEEEFFKMAFYIDRRRAGMVPRAAALAAEQALFNYRRVPKLVDVLRRTGVVPFLTFPYKALPATARAAVNRPHVLNQYGNIFRVFEGPDPGVERQVLRDYMKDGWMRLPGVDQENRVRYVNMAYILPFGDIGELATGGGFGGRGGAAPSFLNSPFFSLATVATLDTDPFLPFQEVSDQPGGRLAWLRRFLAPPLFGGYAMDEIRAALQKRPINILSRTAEPRSLKDAIAANFFGIRIRPLNLEEEREWRILDLEREIDNIFTQVRRWENSPWITPEERNLYLAEQMAAIRELYVQAGTIAALQLPEAPQLLADTPPNDEPDLIIEQLLRQQVQP